MVCIRLTLVASGLAFAFASAAAAQPREDRDSYDGACFYENANFGGHSFCLRAGQVLETLPHGMNDRVSSIRTFGRSAVIVFRDRSFGGGSLQFEGDVADLRQANWNDRISSVQVRHSSYGHRDGSSDRQEFRRGSEYEAQIVVRNAYRSVLSREPDPASEGYVEHVLRDGWSQADVERDLRRSDEYRNRIR
jgi:hypothetical protein